MCVCVCVCVWKHEGVWGGALFFVIGAHVDEAAKVDADGRNRKGRHAAARRVARHKDVPRLLLGPAPVKRNVGRSSGHEGLNLANVKRLFRAVGADPEGLAEPADQQMVRRNPLFALAQKGSLLDEWRRTSSLDLRRGAGVQPRPWRSRATEACSRFCDGT